jgi:hypothetical protein
MELWRTMENLDQRGESQFRWPSPASGGWRRGLLPAGGTAKMAQIARPMFSFP